MVWKVRDKDNGEGFLCPPYGQNSDFFTIRFHYFGLKVMTCSKCHKPNHNARGCDQKEMPTSANKDQAQVDGQDVKAPVKKEKEKQKGKAPMLSKSVQESVKCVKGEKKGEAPMHISDTQESVKIDNKRKECEVDQETSMKGKKVKAVVCSPNRQQRRSLKAAEAEVKRVTRSSNRRGITQDATFSTKSKKNSKKLFVSGDGSHTSPINL